MTNTQNMFLFSKATLSNLFHYLVVSVFYSKLIYMPNKYNVKLTGFDVNF